jgi:uncharacterized protein (UPF0276 family)
VWWWLWWRLRRVRRVRRLRWMSARGDMSMIATLPVLGAGLGYREPYRADVLLNGAGVDFLEVIADHYLDAPAEKLRELDLLAERYTLIPHGLNLSLGSGEGLDPDYRDRLLALVRRLDPPWWSEHVAFTRAGGVEIGHLAPLPFSREALDVLAANIAEVQGLTGTPLILENITYTFALPGSELEEADFLAALLERTGCGLLLDVANLHINAVNHHFDPFAFLARLPLDKVVQLHFAGGHQEGELLLDSHSAAAPTEVWALLDHILSRAPVKGVILERDERLPPFATLLEELGRVRQVWGRRGP